MLVVGDQEERSETVTPRRRHAGREASEAQALEVCARALTDEIRQRRR
jgi:threonyl-tRNA synthetase